MNKRSKFSDENFKNKCVDLFKKGVKSKDISKQLNISKTALIRNLDLLGYNFDRSVSMQKYNLNRNYFKKIDSFEKAYWLGLIYADGSNKIYNNTFVLGLKKEDSYILNILQNVLLTDVPIKMRKAITENHSDFHRLEIYNKELCLDLLSHGVMENKTSILKKPNIEENLIFSFIRGYFDGDGSICTTTNLKGHRKDSITFTGTREIVDFISGFLKNKLNINCCLYERHPDRDNNNYTISINGRLNVIKLCDEMYKNKSNHFFVRKYERYLKIKNRYE